MVLRRRKLGRKCVQQVALGLFGLAASHLDHARESGHYFLVLGDTGDHFVVQIDISEALGICTFHCIFVSVFYNNYNLPNRTIL